MEIYWLSLHAIVPVIVPDCHKQMHMSLCVYVVLMFPDLMLSSLKGSRRSSSWTESCPMTSWEDKSLTVWPNTSSSVRTRCCPALCVLPVFGIFVLTVTALAKVHSLKSVQWPRDNLFRFFVLQGNTKQTGSPQLFQAVFFFSGATRFSLLANHKASSWMACCFRPIGGGGR